MNPLQHKNVEKGQFVILGTVLMVLTMENRYSYNSILEVPSWNWNWKNSYDSYVTVLL